MTFQKLIGDFAVLIVNQTADVVIDRLIQKGVFGERLSGFLCHFPVLAQVLLYHGFPFDRFPECLIRFRRKVFQAVGNLVAKDKQDRAGVVLFDPDLAILILARRLALKDTPMLHKLHGDA